MNHYLPMGTTSQDISQNEVCSRCQRQIGLNEPHILLADEQLADAVVCLECSNELAPDEPAVSWSLKV
jgi:hypothetical protein